MNAGCLSTLGNLQEGEKMKCHSCEKKMLFQKGLQFNEFQIDGWRCSCGEIYYDPEQAGRILLINKLRKEQLRAKLGKIKSNLIIRVPKELESALCLKKGKDVIITVQGKGFSVFPA